MGIIVLFRILNTEECSELKTQVGESIIINNDKLRQNKASVIHILYRHSIFV